ncbi:MAG: 50S ribosomal protein L10 [Acidimicrobiia bacterium]|nr:50S ribosomal protein L10 [Acidimicrobiia bacterium]
MPRPEKVRAVAEIKERIDGARAVFVTEFRGLSVMQVQTLRRALRDSGADYKVYKMTLTQLAVDELGIAGMEDFLSGPTALAFANTDAVTTAKVLKDANKENENLVIKAGILSGEVLLPEQISKLAEIEPRDVLLAKIAGVFKAPTTQLAGLLGAFTRNAATMFSQLLEKKESVETPATPEAPAPEAELVPVAEAVVEEPVEAPAEPEAVVEEPVEAPTAEAEVETEAAEVAEEE